MKKAIVIAAGTLFVSTLTLTFSANGSMKNTAKENSFSSTIIYQDTTDKKKDSTRPERDSLRSIKLINLRP